MNLENFTIRKNKFKKEGSNQPDYNISTKIGEEWKSVGGCWIKEDKNKEKFFSCRVSPPQPKENAKADIPYPTEPDPNSIPF